LSSRWVGLCVCVFVWGQRNDWVELIVDLPGRCHFIPWSLQLIQIIFKNNFLPHSKHTACKVQRPVSLCCLGQESLNFVQNTLTNTQGPSCGGGGREVLPPPGGRFHGAVKWIF
jgi:hypothetical protein